MSKFRGQRPLQLLVALFVSAIALPVMAGLIYTWEDDLDPNVTGSIELADGIGFGDTFDPFDPGNIVDFNFLIDGAELGYDAFYTLTDIEPSRYGLCSPNCDTHGELEKKAAKKKAGDEDYIYFEPLITKKAAKKKGGDTPPPIFRWSYVAGITQDVVDENGKKTAKKKGGDIFEGTGFWVLNGPVPVPEPGALVLLLSGVAILTHLRKRFSARFRAH